MNVVDVLNLLGYEVLRVNHKRQVYLVKKMALRAQRERIKHNREFKLKLNEIGFDDAGDFYVNFTDTWGKTVLDEYWHNNMQANQLYDIDFGSLHYEKEEVTDDDFSTPTQQDDWVVEGSSMYRFL